MGQDSSYPPCPNFYNILVYHNNLLHCHRGMNIGFALYRAETNLNLQN